MRSACGPEPLSPRPQAVAREEALVSHEEFMQRMAELNARLENLAERSRDQAERLKSERLERGAVEPFVIVDDWAWVEFLADHPELLGQHDA